MSRILILFTFLFTTLFAQKDLEEFPFIGVTVGINTLDIKPVSDSYKENETTFGMRYGKQTKDWRTMFLLAGNDKFQSFSLEIDKILMDELFGMPEFRPYLGATVGYLFYDDGPVDGESFYYGGNFGFLFYITDTIDADLSYHYYKVDDLEPLDNIEGGTLGIHYFY